MKQEENIDHIRHSAAHLLAAAVLELYPKAKNTIGPAIENGFYYDFDLGGENVSEADFPKIEAKMAEILKKWKRLEAKEVTSEEAKGLYKDNEYKKELIEELSSEGKTLTIYTSVDEEGKSLYFDLCKGGHSKNPIGDIRAFKLLSTAGAYWRGNEKNKMLTRIYGTCFSSKEELADYLLMLEEAKKEITKN